MKIQSHTATGHKYILIYFNALYNTTASTTFYTYTITFTIDYNEYWFNQKCEYWFSQKCEETSLSVDGEDGLIEKPMQI